LRPWAPNLGGRTRTVPPPLEGSSATPARIGFVRQDWDLYGRCPFGLGAGGMAVQPLSYLLMGDFLYFVQKNRGGDEKPQDVVLRNLLLRPDSNTGKKRIKPFFEKTLKNRTFARCSKPKRHRNGR
jgi:hypothetical protein